MYKIYINGTPLFIVNTGELDEQFSPTEGALIRRYSGKAKSLYPIIDSLEKTHAYTHIVVHHADASACFDDFKSLYKKIDAAGGLVFKSPKKKKILLIHRRGYYDLPKGKVDPGENNKAAALREVEEETGLKKIKLGKKIMITYHTYRDRDNKRILKRTHWFKMTTKQKKLVPQLEEDIKMAFWIKPKKFLSVQRQVYGNILDVIHKGCKK